MFAGAGSTPLHYAACGGNAQCCQILISRGASLTAKNIKGYVIIVTCIFLIQNYQLEINMIMIYQVDSCVSLMLQNIAKLIGTNVTHYFVISLHNPYKGRLH